MNNDVFHALKEVGIGSTCEVRLLSLPGKFGEQYVVKKYDDKQDLLEELNSLHDLGASLCAHKHIGGDIAIPLDDFTFYTKNSPGLQQ